MCDPVGGVGGTSVRTDYISPQSSIRDEHPRRRVHRFCEKLDASTILGARSGVLTVEGVRLLRQDQAPVAVLP